MVAFLVNFFPCGRHGSSFSLNAFESILKQVHKLAPELHRVSFLSMDDDDCLFSVLLRSLIFIMVVECPILLLIQVHLFLFYPGSLFTVFE